MEASKSFVPTCDGCGENKCPTCGLHIGNSDLCPACIAVDNFDALRIDEQEMQRITSFIEKKERDLSGCPECEGGRPCNPLCDECSMLEMQDQLRHERSHSPGSF